MAGIAAVGVDDDLATGQTAVAVRTTDHESPGRVDVVLGLAGEQVRGHDGGDHMLLDVVLDRRLLDARRVLGRHDDGGDADESTMVIASESNKQQNVERSTMKLMSL